MKNWNKFLSLYLVLLGFGVASCDDNAEPLVLNTVDYIIFGHFYGECIGEQCVELFKLTDTELLEDTLDQYPGIELPYTGEYVDLGATLYQEVADLIDFIPTELLEEEEQSFGCPDCADQGGVYIEYVKQHVSKAWRIDQSISDVPEYLHELVEKINEKITLINE